MTPISTGAPAPTESSKKPDIRTELREKSIALEANFLAEMLKSAGLGKTRDAFGGGIGEDQFGSFLRQQQAEHLAQNGGFGLAESIYQSLLEKVVK